MLSTPGFFTCLNLRGLVFQEPRTPKQQTSAFSCSDWQYNISYNFSLLDASETEHQQQPIVKHIFFIQK